MQDRVIGRWYLVLEQHPEVNIYDSVYCSCSDHNKIKIPSILVTTESMIKLRYILLDVQTQSGAADCGIFTIAFVTALTHGHLPGQYFLHQSAMRAHLLQCFESGNLTMFPIQKTRCTFQKIKRVENLPTYCTCRMPIMSGSECI